MPWMSCGMSSRSARSPSAVAQPGVGARTALVARDVEAPGPAEAVGDDRVEVGRGRRCSGSHLRSALIAGGPQQLGAHEAVEVAVEHALGVAHLEVVRWSLTIVYGCRT